MPPIPAPLSALDIAEQLENAIVASWGAGLYTRDGGTGGVQSRAVARSVEPEEPEWTTAGERPSLRVAVFHGDSADVQTSTDQHQFQVHISTDIEDADARDARRATERLLLEAAKQVLADINLQTIGYIVACQVYHMGEIGAVQIVADTEDRHLYHGSIEFPVYAILSEVML